MAKGPLRKFSTLRETARAAKNSVVGDADAAFRWLGQTPQGDAIREYLAMIVCDTTPCNSESAWREQQARRTFAEQILSKMDGGVHDDGKPGQPERFSEDAAE